MEVRINAYWEEKDDLGVRKCSMCKDEIYNNGFSLQFNQEDWSNPAIKIEVQLTLKPPFIVCPSCKDLIEKL